MRLANTQAELDLTKEIKANSKRFLTTKIKGEQRNRKWCVNSASIGANINFNIVKKSPLSQFSVTIMM